MWPSSSVGVNTRALPASPMPACHFTLKATLGVMGGRSGSLELSLLHQLKGFRLERLGRLEQPARTAPQASTAAATRNARAAITAGPARRASGAALRAAS